MSSFTPGPWRIKYGTEHDPETCRITICGDIFLLADINGPNYAHCEANALLIAAAPDLFEALQNLTDNIEHAFPSLSHLGPVIAAREALAKAVGK